MCPGPTRQTSRLCAKFVTGADPDDQCAVVLAAHARIAGPGPDPDGEISARAADGRAASIQDAIVDRFCRDEVLRTWRAADARGLRRTTMTVSRDDMPEASADASGRTPRRPGIPVRGRRPRA